jgi:hypothetical protein
MDVAPFIENGRTFVPVRFLAYALGIPEEAVIWNPEIQNVWLSKECRSLLCPSLNVVRQCCLQLGEKHLEVWEFGVFAKRIEMDVAPVLRSGRVFLPARYVAEAFDYSVVWDEKERVVYVCPLNGAKPASEESR